MKHVTLLLIIIFTLIPLTQAKEIYKWVDENGKVHFGDKKPEALDVEAIDINVINSIKRVSYESSNINIGRQVIIYTTNWCGYCKKAKQYFKENAIRYTEMNIEKSKTAKLQYDKLGGKGVPVILLGDKRMSGFSEAGFERFYSRTN
ncbi:glutaredoxin family protein [Colwellia sp. 75C3]|uniref:glutaredoxin family protein n=1 Tax=Colwellia sp. 75C3 TaxID=888425 RepID=UPI000C320477|nr:glutaredoxin family protein [Colwellia sp. 75C3]PKG80648.1 glutaredoxin family protein [Colwellia sp. 75C3]